MMEFKIMGRKGDAVFDYDMETAEIKFNELLSAGMLPVEADESGGSKPVASFRRDLERVTWIPRIAGG